MIELGPRGDDDDHLALLGLLNSSTACFWLKQVCFPKGGDPSARREPRGSSAHSGDGQVCIQRYESRIIPPAGRTANRACPKARRPCSTFGKLKPPLASSAAGNLAASCRARVPPELFRGLPTRMERVAGANDRTPGGNGLGVLPALRTCQRGLTYGAEPPPLRFGSGRPSRSRCGPRWSRGSCRRPGSSGTAGAATWTARRVAAGLSRSRPSPDGGHCDKPEHRAHRTARVQAPLERGPWPISSRARYGLGFWTTSNPTSISTAG